jgi:lipopolysaccharide assembly outer membrane protein LptD (OstA)
MDVFFARSQDAAASQSNANAAIGNKIDKIVARGNVKITRGENISYSDEAIYNAADKKITLSGRPKLILYSAEDLKDATSGN